jgi:hypothetical protein
MENNNVTPAPQPCGPNCDCKTEKGLSRRTKIVLLAIIITCAGAVLAGSIIRKSRQPAPTPPTGYAAALSLKPDAPVKTDSASRNEKIPLTVTFAGLPSFSALDTVAAGFGGVFILVVKSNTEKTPAIAQEISNAANAIASQGMRMGVFQLASGTPDFELINSQLPSPGVLVVVKGRGMRGVAGKNITKTNLLQACVAAMQPSSCCPAGGNRVCK